MWLFDTKKVYVIFLAPSLQTRPHLPFYAELGARLEMTMNDRGKKKYGLGTGYRWKAWPREIFMHLSTTELFDRIPPTQTLPNKQVKHINMSRVDKTEFGGLALLTWYLFKTSKRYFWKHYFENFARLKKDSFVEFLFLRIPTIISKINLRMFFFLIFFIYPDTITWTPCLESLLKVYVAFVLELVTNLFLVTLFFIAC